MLRRFSLAIALLAGQLVDAQDSAKTLPVFKDGLAQEVEGFKDAEAWIRHDLWVETEFDSDGNGKRDRMHVDVTRPKQTDTEGLKVPVVYETSPYYSRQGEFAQAFFWNTKLELGIAPLKHENLASSLRELKPAIISKSHVSRWLPLGFAVVHSASPGTELSEGCPTVGGDNESLAPKAVIDWLCGRAKGYTSVDGSTEVTAPWCSGKVGMLGTSYNGTLPLAAATTGVPGLEAIIPVAPNTSYYHYYRSNGLVRHPGGYMGEDIDVLYDFIHSGNEDFRNHCDCEVRDKLMAEGQDRVTGDYNAFWASRDYLNRMGPMKAALLMAHGFNDWNVVPEHSVRIYEAAKAKGLPVNFYCHQGGHGGDPPFEMMNRWFTRYLYGIENDVEKQPKAWIVREGAKRENPTAYADYPHPDARHIQLNLTGEGQTAGMLTAGKLTKPSELQSISESFVDDAAFDGATLAQAQQSEHRLLYVTPELKEPLHISGYPKISIRLACSKPAANLTVWLVCLPWNPERTAPITDNIITRGWADPQNYKSLTSSEPLTPGKYYSMHFALQPDDQIIPAGKKIGLMIFSSDPEFTLQPEAGTVLTIDLAHTSLDLPIVGGEEAWHKSTEHKTPR